jgi:hypothetical protein
MISPQEQTFTFYVHIKTLYGNASSLKILKFKNVNAFYLNFPMQSN